MECITVSLYIRDLKLLDATVTPTDAVETLANAVRAKTGRDCVLVFGGSVLAEQHTLDHYNITQNSKVFVVQKREKPAPRKSPRELILELFHCTRRLEACPYEEYRERVAKIETYLRDERVCHLVEVDPWAETVVSHVIDYVENCTRQLSDSERHTICQIEDNWITQLEQTQGGWKILKDALEEPEPERRVMPTVISEKADDVSDTPLPACWFRIAPQFGEFDIKSKVAQSRPPLARQRLAVHE